MPTADGSATEFLKEATQSMGNAEGHLEEGQSVQGEGYQRDAARKIQNTIDRLQQQQQEQQQMQQQAQRMAGKGKKGQGKGNKDKEGGGKDHDGEEIGDTQLDLTEKMTPEEYREALLEGMSGSVPEEYERLKKRYYEELVQQ